MIEKKAEDKIRDLIALFEDPSREGLVETPARVAKAWREFTCGYEMDPAEILKTFDDGAKGSDEMVLVANVPVRSMCEHHCLPWFGVAHLAYIPNGRIVGLSKMSRLVEVYARRLQVQERFTQQLADALDEHLKPLGVGVVVTATHSCMMMRGVKVTGSLTTTSALRGVIKREASARAELFKLIELSK